MSPRFVLGRENVPCVAEVVNSRSKLIVQTLKRNLRKCMITIFMVGGLVVDRERVTVKHA